MRNALRVLLCLIASATSFSAVGQAASFTGLGFLPGASTDVTHGVSADGSTVVGASNNQAFLWTAGAGMVGIAPPDADVTEAWSASADGSAAVGLLVQLPIGAHAFRWTASDGLVDLGTLPGGSASRAAAVSADGSVVAGVSDDQAFRWTAGAGMIGLGFLAGGTRSVAEGISADGSVVVGFGVGDSFEEAFRWTSAGGMVGLGFLPGAYSSAATGVSADGSVVVGISSGEAFRWNSGGGMSGLGFVSGTDHSFAAAVSADGSVVVGTATDSSVGELSNTPFIWDAAHGTRSLPELLTGDYGVDLTGWTLGIATGVSADGLTIVGYGTNPSGQTEGWIASIPEPGTALLVTIGVMGLASSRRRRSN